MFMSVCMRVSGMCVCECGMCMCEDVCVLTCCVRTLSNSDTAVDPCPGRFHCTVDETESFVWRIES